MSSALVVSLYYALVPLLVIAISTVLIIRGYGNSDGSER